MDCAATHAPTPIRNQGPDALPTWPDTPAESSVPLAAHPEFGIRSSSTPSHRVVTEPREPVRRSTRR